MRLRFALGSWSNRHFEHTLYPLRTPHEERLARYASVFDAVELDVLHHVEAEEGTLQEWARQVPNGFTFLPKLHKGASHGAGPTAGGARGRSKAVEGFDIPDSESAARAANEFSASLAPLRESGHLGRILIQLPPSLERVSGWDRLMAVLGELGPGTAAVELRHSSWFVPAVENLLEDFDAPLVWSTYPKAFAPPWRTSSVGFVRFTGTHFETKGRHVTVAERLEDVLEVRKRLAQATWDECFVVVTNPFEGNAVDSLPRIAAALGEAGLARRVTRKPGEALFPDSRFPDVSG